MNSENFLTSGLQGNLLEGQLIEILFSKDAIDRK